MHSLEVGGFNSPFEKYELQMSQPQISYLVPRVALETWWETFRTAANCSAHILLEATEPDGSIYRRVKFWRDDEYVSASSLPAHGHRANLDEVPNFLLWVTVLDRNQNVCDSEHHMLWNELQSVLENMEAIRVGDG